MASRVAGAASVLLLVSSLVLQLRGGWCEKPFTLTLLTQAAEKVIDKLMCMRNMQ